MGGRAVAGESAALRDDLLQTCRHGARAPLDDAGFDTLARRVFAHQFERNRPFAAFCRRRRRTPDDVTHWSQIPVVPTAAFQELPLVAGDARDAVAVFHTSGTTGGLERRGSRYMLDLELYHAAALAFFDDCVAPDGASLTYLSLMPSPRELPHSSLAHMIGLILEQRGGAAAACFASVAGGLDAVALLERLRLAERDTEPLCLLGTTLAFVHLLDLMAEQDVRLALAPGSRLMDTGGSKGATRRVEPSDLRAAYRARLGLADAFCVNEYGMTELCSQFYDAALRDHIFGIGRTDPDRKIGPPWVRTRVVDPVTLDPVAPGERGILQHFDLANLDAVIAIQTEDQAVEVPGGFVLLGRDPAAPPRGCSIAMDELMRAARSS